MKLRFTKGINKSVILGMVDAMLANKVSLVRRQQQQQEQQQQQQQQQQDATPYSVWRTRLEHMRLCARVFVADPVLHNCVQKPVSQ
jgi:membrane protease subunit (stomatin/prohibitin family)